MMWLGVVVIHKREMCVWVYITAPARSQHETFDTVSYTRIASKSRTVLEASTSDPVISRIILQGIWRRFELRSFSSIVSVSV